MIGALEALDGLGSELGRRARRAGALLVWRAQARSYRSLVVRAGRVESSSDTSLTGHGAQVFLSDGGTALASRDDLRPEAALALFQRALGVAEARAGDGPRPVELPPVRRRELPPGLAAFQSVDLPAIGRRLMELEGAIAARVPGAGLRLGFHADLDAWRIFRSDGTDVLFAMPRCRLTLLATGGRDGGRHGVHATVFGPTPDLPFAESATARFLRRAERAARLARELPDAPPHPAGTYPLVIDYALAKGLAHEAFGHAAEADGFRSSVLAEHGRFRRGASAGPAHVSIIDEPLPDDHAWQPISANGLPRERVVIVDHGKLSEALSDPWSAGPGGVPLSGAARARSFRDAPLPRMSNIRIEVDDPLPAPGAFEDYGPAEVGELLQRAGVLARHPELAYLSGYTGGQVNSATGDFVFNCQAIYRIGRGAARLHRPAIFSGSMFGALGAIREAFGPLQLDAIGHCGKWGQQVPSSGGSHYFLVLEPDPTVRLGGS